MSDRGVSEVLGFVLVFALIVSTIGVVYATSFDGLDDARQAEKFRNVERAFDVLADNVEDLYRSEAPSRATEIKLAGGSLSAGEVVEIRVFAVEVGNPSNNETFLTTMEPISYEDEDTAIHYVNGAVLRSESTGAAMLSAPDWVLAGDRAVVPLVSTSSGEGGVAGDGSVLVVADRNSQTLNGPFDPSGADVRVNVTVSSERAASWKRYFEDEGLDAVDDDPTDGNVTYQFETERVYVPKTSVEVTFDR